MGTVPTSTQQNRSRPHPAALDPDVRERLHRVTQDLIVRSSDPPVRPDGCDGWMRPPAVPEQPIPIIGEADPLES
jgi:hypothetical protein